MKRSLTALLLCCSLVLLASGPAGSAYAQAAAKAPLSPPMKADVTLPSGMITIDYSAPSMKGRKIFDGLVPYGEVWRTGANAATTLTTTAALQIGNLSVPAGKYTLYSMPTADGWTLIVNKQTGQWGTVYDKSQDLGRIPMTVGKTPSPVETFVIDFEKTMGAATELHLKWAGVDASVSVKAS